MNLHTTQPRATALHAIAALCLWAAASGGCAANPTANAPPDAAATAPAAPEPLIRAALEDAARHTGLPVAQLRLIDATLVTWADGSLGCPEPGLMYPQMLVPGFRITIEAAGKRLDYHASKRGALLLCPGERAIAPLPPPSARSTVSP